MKIITLFLSIFIIIINIIINIGMKYITNKLLNSYEVLYERYYLLELIRHYNSLIKLYNSNISEFNKYSIHLSKEISYNIYKSAMSDKFKYIDKYLIEGKYDKIINTYNKQRKMFIHVKDLYNTASNNYNTLNENINSTLDRLFSNKIKFILGTKRRLLKALNLPIFDIPKFYNACLSYSSFELKYITPTRRDCRSCIITLCFDNTSIKFISYLNKYKNTNNTEFKRKAISKSTRDFIFKRDNYTCRICGASLYKEPNLLLEIDHIIPVSKGGTNEISNLQLLCWRCNRSKYNKL